ncbi:MAG: zinc-binding dehydrogenase [Verrucomicrobia bacterium]|nr:zinc-binding dehydrogenase [Verrucomicrobiota bacterium]
MKAVVFHEHGGIEKLSYQDVPTPRPGPGEVLIKLHAASLNHLDIWVRQGLPGMKLAFPHIGGSDGAGEVAEVGEGVRALEKGQRVVVSPSLSCGECSECLDGRDNLCPDFRLFGLQVPGTYAEYVVAPARSVFPVSGGLSFEQWAAVPLVFLTSWNMLVATGKIEAGETVLIHAAGSGIGSAAIVIAKHLGARVITTAGTDEKLEKAKALGADETINYNKVDFAPRVKQLTGGAGADLVFEHIGPPTWPGNLACLAKGGRMVVCGATGGPHVQLDVRPFYTRQLSITGCYLGTRGDLRCILELVEQGALKPVIDAVFPLKEAAAAQQKMLDRDFFGKLVLQT